MAGPTSQYERSISRQMTPVELRGNPEDLISAIYLDHEQAHKPAVSRSFSHTPVKLSNDYPTSYYIKLSTAPTQSLPVASNPGIAAPISERDAESLSLNVDQLRMRSVSAPSSVVQFQKSHWKPVAQASKCGDPNCRKKFTRLERARNCSMCGEVFCKRCTNYRRKLSTSAAPDPFGTFYNVCCKCFNHHTVFGGSRDLMKDFGPIRRAKLSVETSEATKCLCGGRDSSSKRKAMTKEIERLMKGFVTNSGFLKGFLSEMKVPDWQKSENWVESRDASQCYECSKAFNKLSRKIHCRIGGQVFCPGCCKDEIVIYLEEREGEPRWGINGKSGGPKTTPLRFEMYPVCSSCSAELQSILLENISKSSSGQDGSFMDDVSKLHQSLSKLQQKVEEWLPQYEQVVDAMDIVDNSPRNLEDKHPLRKLAKAQSDLSDALTVLAVQSQKLKLLKPQSPIEQRLLKHMMIGVYQFYQEHMYHFRCTRKRLAEHTPTEHLMEIQRVLSQQSMERVHIVVQQLMYEALDLEKRYKFDNSFFMDIIEIIRSIEDEFKPFLEEKGDSWDDHSEVVKMFIKEEVTNNRRRIKLGHNIGSNPQYIKYVVISQCSSVVQECYRELEAKTMDREFRKTKTSLNDARLKLDEALLQPS